MSKKPLEGHTNRKTRHRRAAWLCRMEGFRPKEYRWTMKRLRRLRHSMPRPHLGRHDSRWHNRQKKILKARRRPSAAIWADCPLRVGDLVTLALLGEKSSARLRGARTLAAPD